MKKFSIYAVLLSMSLFVIGCAPPKPAAKPEATEAPAAEKADMPAEGDKPAAEPAPEKPAETK